MARPLVSIFLITYNHREFIADALRSALEQDYLELEVVVGDDGSTDGTVEIIEQFAKEYHSRLVVLPSTVNQGIEGLIGNANRILKRCRGDYIAFLDGDDLYLPGKIEQQVKWFEADARRVLCGHDVEVFDSTSGQSLYLWGGRFGLRSGEGALSVVRDNVPFTTVSVMVRAAAVPTRGFDNRLRVVGDWKLWIDCLASGGSFGFVDGVYARHRRHRRNITNFYQELRKEDQFVTLALTESQYPHLYRACRYGRARLHYRLGISALFQGDRHSARRHLLQSIREKTFARPRAWAALLLTMTARSPARALVRWGGLWSHGR